MYPGTHIERATSDYALATFRDLYIVIWHRNTTMTGAQAVRRGCFAFAESRPKGVALSHRAIVETISSWTIPCALIRGGTVASTG